MKNVLILFCCGVLISSIGYGQPINPSIPLNADSVFEGIIHQVSWEKAERWRSNFVLEKEQYDPHSIFPSDFYFPAEAIKNMYFDQISSFDQSGYESSARINYKDSEFSSISQNYDFAENDVNNVDGSKILDELKKAEDALKVFQFSFGAISLGEYLLEEIPVYENRYGKMAKEERLTVSTFAKALTSVDPKKHNFSFLGTNGGDQSDIHIQKELRMWIKEFNALAQTKLKKEEAEFLTSFLFTELRDKRINYDMLNNNRIITMIIFPLDQNFNYLNKYYWDESGNKTFLFLPLEHPVICPPFCKP